MHVTVVLYGGLKARAGVDRLGVDVPEQGCTVATVVGAVAAAQPALASALDRVAYVVGDDVVTSAQPVRPGDTVELLPPVSGGWR